MYLDQPLSEQGTIRTPAPVIGERRPEFDPIAVEIPIQVIVYAPDAPKVYDGIGLTYPDGTITITVPEVPEPPAGTTIQIVMYPRQPEPTILEGVTEEGLDGSMRIVIPDDL